MHVHLILQSHTMVVELSSPPSVNAYWRRHGKIMHVSKAGQDYKKETAIRCMVARCKPLEGPVCVSLDWRRPARRGDPR